MVVDGALTILDELRNDAKLGKNKHFYASERKLKYHYYCGIPVVIINVFIGTVVVAILSEQNQPVWSPAFASILSFIAASLSTLQTLFNFHKIAEGHRSIANRYLHISRKCKLLIKKHQDMPLEADTLWSEVESIQKEYSEINFDSEAFPTTKVDLKVARGAVEVTPFTNLPSSSNR